MEFRAKVEDDIWETSFTSFKLVTFHGIISIEIEFGYVKVNNN